MIRGLTRGQYRALIDGDTDRRSNPKDRDQQPLQYPQHTLGTSSDVGEGGLSSIVLAGYFPDLFQATLIDRTVGNVGHFGSVRLWRTIGVRKLCA